MSKTTRPKYAGAGLRLALLLFLMGLAQGCTITRGTPMHKIAGEINATVEGVDFTLVPGDSITIKNPDEQRYDQNVVIRTDGKATFYLINDLALAGLTVAEARERIQSAYSDLLKVPAMTISFTKTGSRNVYIIGQVRAPGQYSVSPGQYPVSPGQNPIFAGQSGLTSDPMSLLELFGVARGPNLNEAALQNTRLIRWIPERRERKTWIIDARPKHWDAKHPIWLQTYDIVYVPNKTIIDVDAWMNQYVRQLIPLPYLFPTGLISPTGQ